MLNFRRAWVFAVLCFSASCLGAAPLSIPASDPLIRYTGRFDFSTPAAPRMGWPGMMIEAAFSGTSIGIKLSEQVAYTSYFDATLDGGAPHRITSSSVAEASYRIEGLGKGKHRLLLVRRSESYSGFGVGQEYSVFHGLELEAGASLSALPAAPKRKMEVIGDSLSVGYGNESPGLSCAGTVSQFTNNYLAYGSLAARSFGAEVHTTAVSGHGMLSNYGQGILSPDPMPLLFKRTIPALEAPLWDFKSWQPDLVVIFLGNNDFSTGSLPPKAPSRADFIAAYNALIAAVRAGYPDSKPWILCLYHHVWDGSASFDLGAYVKEVVKGQNEKLKDLKVSGVDMDPFSGSGCDYHPNLAEDKAMASRLCAAISAATGWDGGKLK
jgi:lysophospholipase L1-like esterase